jgi:hypothetical protein
MKESKQLVHGRPAGAPRDSRAFSADRHTHFPCGARTLLETRWTGTHEDITCEACRCAILEQDGTPIAKVYR